MTASANSFVNRFKKFVEDVTKRDDAPKEQMRPLERAPVTLETFDAYQIVKRKGNDEKIIAMGLTLNEAKRLNRILQSRINTLHAPNDDGIPYFELEIYKVTVSGRERYFEKVQPRFDPETRWIG